MANTIVDHKAIIETMFNDIYEQASDISLIESRAINANDSNYTVGYLKDEEYAFIEDVIAEGASNIYENTNAYMEMFAITDPPPIIITAKWKEIICVKTEGANEPPAITAKWKELICVTE